MLLVTPASFPSHLMHPEIWLSFHNTQNHLPMLAHQIFIYIQRQETENRKGVRGNEMCVYCANTHQWKMYWQVSKTKANGEWQWSLQKGCIPNIWEKHYKEKQNQNAEEGAFYVICMEPYSNSIAREVGGMHEWMQIVGSFCLYWGWSHIHMA